LFSINEHFIVIRYIFICNHSAIKNKDGTKATSHGLAQGWPTFSTNGPNFSSKSFAGPKNGLK
jgi:hypothetical protein